MTGRETMTLPEPRALDELAVIGCLDAFATPRLRPHVRHAVLQGPDDAVYFAPFILAEGVLVAVGQIGNLAEFQQAVASGLATELRPPVKARSDACFYFPTGSGAAEYTSYPWAFERLQEFAELECRKGDERLRSGRPDLALKCYELAASTIGGPKYYARMLLTELAEHRRLRILNFLEAVATLTPASRHLDEARLQVWPQLPNPGRVNSLHAQGTGHSLHAQGTGLNSARDQVRRPHEGGAGRPVVPLSIVRSPVIRRNPMTPVNRKSA
jgi:hypothetical protein